MENKKKIKEPVMDFDAIRALNEYIDDGFLNKTLQTIRGGSKADPSEIITYRINNTNYLANLYKDPKKTASNKKVMLLDSIFKIPENFSLDKADEVEEVDKLSEDMNNIDLGGAKRKPKIPKIPQKKKEVKKPDSKKKGGSSELYKVDYDSVEELGGKCNNDDNVGKKKRGRPTVKK